MSSSFLGPLSLSSSKGMRFGKSLISLMRHGIIKTKRDASLYEFDTVINCDYIWDSRGAAEIVEKAFREKFRAA
jgi:hypothetical protein